MYCGAIERRTQHSKDRLPLPIFRFLTVEKKTGIIKQAGGIDLKTSCLEREHDVSETPKNRRIFIVANADILFVSASSSGSSY